MFSTILLCMIQIKQTNKYYCTHDLHIHYTRFNEALVHLIFCEYLFSTDVHYNNSCYFVTVNYSSR